MFIKKILYALILICTIRSMQRDKPKVVFSMSFQKVLRGQISQSRTRPSLILDRVSCPLGAISLSHTRYDNISPFVNILI